MGRPRFRDPLLDSLLSGPNDAADVYSLNLAAGELISVQLAPSFASEPFLEILDAGGNTLAHGEWSYNEAAPKSNASWHPPPANILFA